MTTALTTLIGKLATTFDMGDGADLSGVLKATCFKSGTPVSDAQMTALLVVANQYKLNPFTKEIFAFPDKGGIVPVVGLDGWSRIINERPEMDGMEFLQDAESCTCVIYRKDRSHPIKVTEWMEECRRDNSPAWRSHPRRMLRHKAMIQCARLAFGFAGIYDEDEAKRIEEVGTRRIDPTTGEIQPIPAFNITEALNAVEACAAIADIDTVFQDHGAKAMADKDKGGYAALRQAVRDKKVALAGAPDITDVEAKAVPA
jgi:phage recombination protein Bet